MSEMFFAIVDGKRVPILPFDRLWWRGALDKDVSMTITIIGAQTPKRAHIAKLIKLLEAQLSILDDESPPTQEQSHDPASD